MHGNFDICVSAFDIFARSGGRFYSRFASGGDYDHFGVAFGVADDCSFPVVQNFEQPRKPARQRFFAGTEMDYRRFLSEAVAQGDVVSKDNAFDNFNDSFDLLYTLTWSESESVDTLKYSLSFEPTIVTVLARNL